MPILSSTVDFLKWTNALHAFETALIGAQDLIVKIIGHDLFETSILALVSAGIGAYAGARGAQAVAEKSALRTELLAEIRDTNSAIVACFNSFSAYMGLKHQHVLPTHNRFYAERYRISDIKNRINAGETFSAPIAVAFEFLTINPFTFPGGAIESILFEKLSIAGRALSLVGALIRQGNVLEQILINRNHYILSFRERTFASPEERMDTYFGFSSQSGAIDTNNKDYIDGMLSCTDDCIIYSKLLIEDLHTHGCQLRSRFSEHFEDPAPKITEVKFDSLTHPELLPDLQKYSDFLSSFVAHDP